MDPVSRTAGITINWDDKNDRLLSIQTARLTLHPIRSDDLQAYQNIFNSVSMENYRGSFTDQRFGVWQARWNEHNFSALAIFLNEEEKSNASQGPADRGNGSREALTKSAEKAAAQGHGIMGHGDCDLQNLGHGWSEMALIFHQSCWNANYAPEDRSNHIGERGKTGLGKEAAKAIVFYARFMAEKGVKVPADIEEKDLDEVLKLQAEGEISEIYYENGKPRAAMLPFTELVATANKSNIASVKILKEAFEVDQEGGGTIEEFGKDNERLRFRLRLLPPKTPPELVTV